VYFLVLEYAHSWRISSPLLPYPKAVIVLDKSSSGSNFSDTNNPVTKSNKNNHNNNNSCSSTTTTYTKVKSSMGTDAADKDAVSITTFIYILFGTI